MALHPFWLIVLLAGIIGIVQALKQWKLVKETLWMVPAAVVVGIGLLMIIAGITGAIKGDGLTIAAGVDAAINGTILGFAASGVYDLVTRIRNR